MTGSTCNINTSKSDTAVYWCESGSGEFSSAVNITVQNDGNGPILVSPVHPVTEGASVSLSCSLRTQKILSNVFFYHNDKLIQNDTRGELKLSAVSKSDEGFYKCQYSGRESAQSWMSVKGADKPPDVIYSNIELENFGNKWKHHKPEQSAVYTNVKTGAAEDSLMYAEVKQPKKEKAKKNKGKSSPAADAAVYSEVTSGSSLSNSAAMQADLFFTLLNVFSS
ncbi:transient receptor potential cation channel subfamily M member 1 [Sarotherodon galilaeus]